MSENEVAVLGVGMHPWGKWGRNFVEYGVDAAQAALADAGLDWQRRRSSWPAPTRCATATRATSPARRSPRPSAGRAAGGLAATPPAPREPRRCDRPAPRSSPASATSPWSSAPTRHRRASSPRTPATAPTIPDWLRFRLLGATNPTYFALYARRRMDLYGATDDDFAQVKVKNARHGLPTRTRATARRSREEEVLACPMVADPLRLLEICATSDGAAAIVARRHGVRRRRTATRRRCGARRSPLSRRRYPNTVHRDARTSPPTRRPRVAAAGLDVPGLDRRGGLRGGRARSRRPRPRRGVRPVVRPRARLVREHRPVQGRRGRAAPQRRRHRRIGGRIPVNPSGGLASFGEAVPAQALAQVCEVVWQLRGQAGDRQVDGAALGITVNQGLFGHGSSVVLST